jgi:hypothetical protein
MARNGLTDLWQAVKFNRREILQLDLYLGATGGAGGLALAIGCPAALLRGVATDAVLLGVIIGAVVAGVAILAAFMDQAFLRKLTAISRPPIRYLAPFLFTAMLGVFASLALISLSVMSDQSPRVLLAIFGFAASFLSVWAIASLLPCLSMIVQFMGLKTDALSVSDNDPIDGS